MKKFASMTVDFISNSTAKILSSTTINFEEFLTGASVCSSLSDTAADLVTLHDGSCFYKITSLADYDGPLTGGYNWAENLFSLYVIANAEPSMPTKVKVGDFITFPKGDDTNIFITKALGFSDFGIHNDDTPWTSLPYDDVEINLVLTALTQHLEEMKITTEQLASFYMQNVASSFSDALLHKRLLDLGYNVYDLLVDYKVNGNNLRVSHKDVLKAYYLTVTDFMLHDFNTMMFDKSFTREQVLALTKVILKDRNLLP